MAAATAGTTGTPTQDGIDSLNLLRRDAAAGAGGDAPSGGAALGAGSVLPTSPPLVRILERRGVAVSAADAAAVQQLLDGSRASASVGWVSLSNHLLISVSRPAGPFANRRVVWLTREGGRGARGGSLAHGCKARVTSLDSVLAVTRLKLEDVARLSPPAGGAHVTVEQLLADTRASSGWNDASLSSAWQPLYELWNREATFAKEPCFRGTKVPAQHASAAPLFNEVVAIVAPIDASAGAAEQAFRIALARVGKHHTPTVGENWSVAYFGPGRVSNTASRSMLLHGRELFAELSRWTADAGGAAAGGAAAAGSAAADGGGHKRRRENDGGGDGGGGEGEEGGGGGGAGEGGGGPASTLVPARAPAPADGRRGGRGGRGRGVGRGGRGGRGGGGGGGESEGGGLAPTLMPAPAPAPDGGRGGRGRGFGPGSVGAQQRASAEAMPPPPPLAPRPAPTATAGEPSVLNPPPRGGAGGVVNSNAPPRGTGAAGFGGGGSGGGAAAAGGAAARPPLERAMDLVLEQILAQSDAAYPNPIPLPQLDELVATLMREQLAGEFEQGAGGAPLGARRAARAAEVALNGASGSKPELRTSFCRLLQQTLCPKAETETLNHASGTNAA